MDFKSIQKGHILLAIPTTNVSDLIFSRSVVLITEQEPEGSVGFIINKPLDVEINTLVPEINANFTVYHGGPVEQDKLFYLHKKASVIPGSIHIVDDLYWGGDYDVLINLINTGQILKEDIRFFLGYSGWDYEQLKNEIDDTYWIHLNNFTDYKKIFLTPSRILWKTYIQKQGKEHSIWVNTPDNPDYN